MFEKHRAGHPGAVIGDVPTVALNRCGAHEFGCCPHDRGPAQRELDGSTTGRCFRCDMRGRSIGYVTQPTSVTMAMVAMMKRNRIASPYIGYTLGVKCWRGWSPHQEKETLLRCGERAAKICVVLGPKKSSTYCSEYASGFLEPAALHLLAAGFLAKGS